MIPQASFDLADLRGLKSAVEAKPSMAAISQRGPCHNLDAVCYAQPVPTERIFRRTPRRLPVWRRFRATSNRVLLPRERDVLRIGWINGGTMCLASKADKIRPASGLSRLIPDRVRWGRSQAAPVAAGANSAIGNGGEIRRFPRMRHTLRKRDTVIVQNELSCVPTKFAMAVTEFGQTRQPHVAQWRRSVVAAATIEMKPAEHQRRHGDFRHYRKQGAPTSESG